MNAKRNGIEQLILFAVPTWVRPVPSYHSIMNMQSLLLVLVFLFAYSASALQQAAVARPASESSDPKMSEDITVTTTHTMLLNGKSLAYTAVAGSTTIDDSKDQPVLSMFSVSYLLTAASAAERPVTFFFNGGPPAAAMWLHMASLGPVRVLTNTPSQTQGPPFTYVPNDYSLLDDSDLVFIDAPLCGFSRIRGEGHLGDFEGTDQDIAAFEKFITNWLSVHDRWNSPKYLFGESYGGTRAAALVAALNNDGVTFSGVTLESPVLNYNVRAPGYDNQIVGLLPTYAAVAYRYGKVQTPLSLAEWVDSARRFARGEYASALMQGDALGTAEFNRIAARVAAFTGLSVTYIQDAKLRVDAPRFRKEFLRAEHKTLGRYDARAQGDDVDSAGDLPDFDAAESTIQGPILASLRTYLSTDLKYRSQAAYYPSAPEPAAPWNWSHTTSTGVQQAQPDVAIDLSDAIRKNNNLKVFVANGYFDMATPFAATEYDVHHMLLPDSLRKNVHLSYYESGHMVYLNVDALRQLKADLHHFYFSR